MHFEEQTFFSECLLYLHTLKKYNNRIKVMQDRKKEIFLLAIYSAYVLISKQLILDSVFRLLIVLYLEYISLIIFM